MATKTKTLSEVKPPAEPPVPPVRVFSVRGTFCDVNYDFSVPAESAEAAKQRVVDDFADKLTATAGG